MTNRIFYARTQLAKGPIIAIGDKDWIVAESSFASRSEGDCTFDAAARLTNYSARVGEHDFADKAGFALAPALSQQAIEHEFSTLCVVGVRTGDARRVDARPTP